MIITNRKNLPEPIVRALSKDEYSKGDSNISMTQLIDSPKIRMLRLKHRDELTQDISEMVWSALGNAVHKIFEEATDNPNHISEERLNIEMDGWVISGAVDLQELEDGMVDITDYKTTSVWSVIFGKSEWEEQLNGYSWLIRHAKGIQTRSLKITAVLRDWSWRDAQYKKDYPDTPMVDIPIEVWSEEDQDRFFARRVRTHQQAAHDYLTGERLPLCTSSETWEKPTKYAVMKDKLKTAKRVLDSYEEAEQWISQQASQAGLRIEERPGECTRCERDFCKVARFCDQFNPTSGE